MILPPSRLVNGPKRTRASDMVMVAYFAAPPPGEETLRVVRVGLRHVLGAMGFLVVDPTKGKPGDATP